MGFDLSQALRHVATAAIGSLVNSGVNALAQKSSQMQQQPLTYVPTKEQAIGFDDGHWSRRDLRRFRKDNNMSKQAFRNWKAELLGYDRNGVDVNRGALSYLEQQRLGDGYAPNFYAQLYLNGLIPQQDPAILLELDRKLQESLGIIPPTSEPVTPEPSTRYVQSDLLYEGQPIINEEVVEEAPIPKLPGIQYAWGDRLTKFWQDENQSALSQLSPELLMAVSGNDGVVSYDDIVKWQQSLGLNGDGKIGSGTRTAMNTKYGTKLPGFVNPIDRNNYLAGIRKKILEDVPRYDYSNINDKKTVNVPWKINAGEMPDPRKVNWLNKYSFTDSLPASEPLPIFDYDY